MASMQASAASKEAYSMKQKPLDLLVSGSLWMFGVLRMTPKAEKVS